MNDVILIKVSDFSKSPFGRVKEDGPNNGRRFRTETLCKALKVSNVTVDMDTGLDEGYEYGSSFLHEAFGGLVMHEGYKAEDLEKKLTITTSHEDVLMEVWDYINDPKGY
jgi:hypothetical protein